METIKVVMNKLDTEVTLPLPTVEVKMPKLDTVVEVSEGE